MCLVGKQVESNNSKTFRQFLVESCKKKNSNTLNYFPHFYISEKEKIINTSSLPSPGRQVSAGRQKKRDHYSDFFFFQRIETVFLPFPPLLPFPPPNSNAESERRSERAEGEREREREHETERGGALQVPSSSSSSPLNQTLIIPSANRVSGQKLLLKKNPVLHCAVVL